MAARIELPIQWNAFPALILTACFAAGITIAEWGAVFSLFPWTLAAGCSMALAATACRLGRRLVSTAPLLLTAAACMMALAAGGAAHTPLPLPEDHVAHRVQGGAHGPKGTIEGWIADYPVRVRQRCRITLAATAWMEGGTVRPAKGQVRVTGPEGDECPALRRGQRLHATGRLEGLPRLRNPSDFDYATFLRRRGINALLYASAPLRATSPECPPTCRLDRLRERLRAAVRRAVPAPANQAMLEALLLGDRSDVDPAERARFVRTGLAHLLAVSGLHVGLVGWLLYRLLGPLLARLRLPWGRAEKLRAAATLGGLSFYMLITGAGAATTRAVLMAAIVLGGSLAQRRAPALNALGAAAFVLLVVRPSQLFEAGFQLSFAAVASLIIVTPCLTRWVPQEGRGRPLAGALVRSAAASIAATLGTTPVLLYHFGGTSFAALLLNPAAIPLTGLALAAGMAALGAGAVDAATGRVFGAAADVLLSSLRGTASAGDAWLSGLYLPAYVEHPAYVLALLLLPLWPACRGRPHLRWRLLLALLLLAAVGLWHEVLSNRSGAVVDVFFFDVGQGDAALVTTPSGKSLLIDTGPGTTQSDRALRAHLTRRGITRLEAIVVTHPHQDHLGGLPAALRSVPVGRVIENGSAYPSALYAGTRRLMDSLSVARTTVQAGDTLVIDRRVYVQVLGPVPALGEGDPNEASIVLRLVVGRVAVLLTGDAETRAERHLVRHFTPLLPARLIKVPHHGSRTSSTPAFTAHVTEGTTRTDAVVSVALRNRYGLPDEDVIERWQQTGARVHTTAQAGAVWMRTDGRRLWRQPWR